MKNSNLSTDLNIFLVSVFGLFTELMLIRWISTEVNIFAYLQNIILITCFLGFGIGCFIGKKKFNDWLFTIPIAILLVALSLQVSKKILANLSLTLSLFGDMVVWNMAELSSIEVPAASVIIVALANIFIMLTLIALAFIPVGSRLGWLIDSHSNTIRAYSANILGSLVGILGFVFLSDLNANPSVWLCIMFALYAYFLFQFSDGAIKHLLVTAVALAIAFTSTPRHGEVSTTWSPYQKLSVLDCQKPNWADCKEPYHYAIHVNNTGYQWIREIGDTENISIEGYNYQVPYNIKQTPESVLVVGAGTGNDVSSALNNGAKRVVAVEIDPAIAEYGKNLHPNKPYASDKVELIVDDARSVFTKTDEKFDVIVFGLLDSHTTTAMTNARLDHYVYTVESITRAKELLKPDGVIVLSFVALREFIAHKLANVFYEVFDKNEVKVLSVAGVATIVAGNGDVIEREFSEQSKYGERLRKLVNAEANKVTPNTKLLTDDWPYIYLRGAYIPQLFYFAGGILLITYLFIARYARVPVRITKWKSHEWHFFFLGAGFLLLEVQNVSKLAILFGSTWSTNAIVISSIMLMILAANTVVSRFPNIPTKVAYLGLLASCLGLYFFDLAALSGLSTWGKVFTAGFITSLPIFFSGIVFIKSFAAAEKKNEALGANMFGSLVGGFLQSLTFMIGVKALLLVVFAIYSCSWALKKR